MRGILEGVGLQRLQGRAEVSRVGGMFGSCEGRPTTRLNRPPRARQMARVQSVRATTVLCAVGTRWVRRFLIGSCLFAPSSPRPPLHLL